MKINAPKSFKKIFAISLLWIILGIIISCFDTSLKYNYFHVIIVNLILLFEVYVVNKISDKENYFSQVISGLEIARDFNLKANQDKLNNIFCKWYFKLIAILMGIAYIYMMLSLEIIKFDTVIFFYGTITLIITVYYAIRLYSKYLIYIFFIKKISDQDFIGQNYNRFFPNRTSWIIDTANFMNVFKYYFSLLGCMYTFEYLATMNKSFLKIQDNSILINTPNNYIFIISWTIIFLFIGLGYFLYSLLIKYYLLKIIKKYENLSLNEYEKWGINEEKKDEYILLYKLYSTNSKIEYTDINFLEHIFPYIPIALNFYKLIKSLF